MLGAAALVVALVGVVATAAATAVARKRQRPANSDPRAVADARRDAQRRTDDARIETDRVRGRQWPH